MELGVVSLNYPAGVASRVDCCKRLSQDFDNNLTKIIACFFVVIKMFWNPEQALFYDYMENDDEEDEVLGSLRFY